MYFNRSIYLSHLHLFVVILQIRADNCIKAYPIDEIYALIQRFFF
ncbi:hypothetical protein AM305_09616 [Actinobacillus minor NM305]|uniref:Uncharacterized protein n=1 Tax=Actinobacillus minor NM305 TaxID=637911 RepID=C5S224_9PAST|nr:hypothetical protein AM305_09616 [Actinobacillus minor NM305]